MRALKDAGLNGYELITESLRADQLQDQQPQSPSSQEQETQYGQGQGQGNGVGIDGRMTLRISVSDLYAAGYSARQLLDSQTQSQQRQQQQQQQQSPFNSSRTVGKVTFPSSPSSSSSLSADDIFSVETLRNGGYTLNELAAVGFTVTQLKSAGFTALDFFTRMKQNYTTSAGDDEKEGHGLRRMRNSTMTPTSSSWSSVYESNSAPSSRQNSIIDLRMNIRHKSMAITTHEPVRKASIGVGVGTGKKTTNTTAPAITTATAAAAAAAAVAAVAAVTAPSVPLMTFTITDLQRAGFPAKDLRLAGFPLHALVPTKLTGYSTIELKHAGYTATDFFQLDPDLFPIKDLKTVGFTPLELSEAGFTLTDLHNAGYHRMEIRHGNFSKIDLLKAGFIEVDDYFNSMVTQRDYNAVVDTLTADSSNEDFAHFGCFAIYREAMMNATNREDLGKAGACEAAVRAIYLHRKDPNIVENACMAIKWLAQV